MVIGGYVPGCSTTTGSAVSATLRTTSSTESAGVATTASKGTAGAGAAATGGAIASPCSAHGTVDAVVGAALVIGAVAGSGAAVVEGDVAGAVVEGDGTVPAAGVDRSWSLQPAATTIRAIDIAAPKRLTAGFDRCR